MLDSFEARLPPPDFAIVGAPKCGTTALWSYLATHPGIAMSARKEPRFWSSDLYPASFRISDRTSYDALWADAPPHALRGEASPVYLQSRVAVPALLAARPDVRLIAMIRNPAEMVASLHSSLVVRFQEDVADLESAWRLQERRIRGEALPRHCIEPAHLQYRANAAIGDMLERFLDTTAPEQRVVIVHDDLRTDTRQEYLRVLRLLGLDDDGRQCFPPVNGNLALRWAGLADFQQWLRGRMLYKPARAIAHAVGIRPFYSMVEANRRSVPRKPLRAGFEEELIGEFLPQIEKAERLLGRNFAAWKKPRAKA